MVKYCYPVPLIPGVFRQLRENLDNCEVVKFLLDVNAKRE